MQINPLAWLCKILVPFLVPACHILYSLAWARCDLASSSVIQAQAWQDAWAPLICSCHPITTSKDVTLGRKIAKTGAYEGKKTWSSQLICYPDQDRNDCFLSLCPTLPVYLHFGHRWSPRGLFFSHFSLFNLFWSCLSKIKTRLFGSITPAWNWMPGVMCTHQKQTARWCGCGEPFFYLFFILFFI